MRSDKAISSDNSAFVAHKNHVKKKYRNREKQNDDKHENAKRNFHVKSASD